MSVFSYYRFYSSIAVGYEWIFNQWIEHHITFGFSLKEKKKKIPFSPKVLGFLSIRVLVCASSPIPIKIRLSEPINLNSHVALI